MTIQEKPPLKVLLCSPRGFCAGVVRAIESVEQALSATAPPVYVRHEIVHNRYVVESLRAKGAIFVEELDEIPDTDAPVIFSAHGVPKRAGGSRAAQPVRARRHLPAGHQGASRGRDSLPARPRDRADRPCRPSGSGRHARPVAGRRGDAGRDASPTPRLSCRATPASLAYVTQTTLSVRRHRRDRRRAQAALPGDRRAAQGRHLLRHHQPPGGGQARRAAGRRHDRGRLAATRRTRSGCSEVAERAGCPYAVLVQRAADIDWTRSTASRRSASPPAPRHRKCWSRKSSTPSRSATP